ncbi:restriction endonuclease subunit S [Lunatimonas salinarum]|uniref:restriction endonuclease subunit S n=1 Tax=Lunatimonas salinarum TaxID=1774590 RepID=UPI001AE0D64B|nr:restriction endonuclease subunit S [Lunatimonas salinarum]
MQKNYKPLGKYIQPADERNAALEDLPLVGISISKQFIKSVANIIGTDLSNYKLIKKNQFACSLMQVSRDGKIPIGMFSEDKAIMSPAYPVFEVKDEAVLIPEYLKMWFERSEFDRQASYYAVGGVRGNLPWEDFLELKLPIPHIDKQREIVKEYNTIQDRITLNQQLIQKLEETAQAIYREWFVEFEFPDENGKPYKSSGGEMVWNEELGKEIPKGWEVKPFTQVVKFGGGGTPSTEKNEYWNGDVPFYTPGDLTHNYYSISTQKTISTLV